MSRYHDYRAKFEENRLAAEAAGETVGFRTTYHDHEDDTPMSALMDLPDGRVIWTSEHGQQLTFESREEAVQWMENDRPEETVHRVADGEYTVKARPADGGVDVMKVRGTPGYPRRMEIGETLYFPTRENAVKWIDRRQPRFEQFDDEDWMFIHDADKLELDEQVTNRAWFVECPGHFRVHFGTAEQASDWCYAQWLGPLFPFEMSEDDIRECGDGFYVDLR